MKEIIKNIKYIARKASASRISAYSAQTAYFMFLSLIPLVMILLSLLKYIGASDIAMNVFSDDYELGVLKTFFELYIDEITDESKLSFTIVTAVVLLWSASRGIFAIISGLNSVYEIKEGRNYFILRFIALFYTVAFIVILVIVLLLMVLGEQLYSFLYPLLPDLKGLVYIVSSLRYIITFVMLVLFFTILYKALPSEKQKFSAQIPGAVIASTGWVVFSILFSFFVDNFSNYASIYGSLTAIIVLLIWLYTCMYIMFIGAEINLIITSKIESDN